MHFPEPLAVLPVALDTDGESQQRSIRRPTQVVRPSVEHRDLSVFGSITIRDEELLVERVGDLTRIRRPCGSPGAQLAQARRHAASGGDNPESVLCPRIVSAPGKELRSIG